MELRQMHAFVTVARELSFRAAAKQLGMSQPPLSRQIKALEDEVGVRLLERGRNRRTVLTEAGQTFLAEAQRTLAAAEVTLRRTREAANGARERLNVASISALSTRVLPSLLEAFRVRHPEVEVFLVEMERTEQVAALREGRIHVGFYPDLSRPRDRQFQWRRVFACPMVAVLPPHHPHADGEREELDIHMLARDTVLVPAPEYSPGYQERLEHTCVAAGFTPAATHPVEGVPNLLGMVAAGYGVALLPEVLVHGQVSTARVRRLGPPVPPFRLNLIWLRQSTSPVLRRFLAVSQEASH